MGLLRLLAGSCLLAAATASVATADDKRRGFQLDFNIIDEEVVEDLTVNWGINLVRIQFGRDDMDGVVGAEYDQKVEELMADLDEKLLLLPDDVRVVFALYTPPGGFQTRIAPSHYAMFSSTELQEQFKATWVKLIRHYGNNPKFQGFALANEPAMNNDLRPEGVKTWNELLLETLAVIRAEDADAPIIITSLYGDPTKLSNLPPVDDANVSFSFNAYPYGRYQHSGIDSAPFSIARPTAALVESKVVNLLAKFLFKQHNRFKKGQLSTATTKLNIGEVAVSACALESGEFLRDLLETIERDNQSPTRKKKKKKRKRNPPKPLDWKDFVDDVKIDFWTYHNYGLPPVWDPTQVCNSDGTFDGPFATDRGDVLLEYFSRNAL